MDFLHTQKKTYLYFIIILLLIIGSLNIYIIYKVDSLKSNSEDIKIEESNSLIEEQVTDITTQEVEPFFVDIKGEINNPGVYLVEEGSIVNELINMAGGLTSDAYIDNINLSKVLSKEMVIVIYSSKEIDKISNEEAICICNDVNITECVDNNASIIVSSGDVVSSTINSKVNINSGSLEELMSLSGIGEAKAKAIIEYRSINGLFKTLEDIKNVSGISDKIYENIKDNIEL